MNVTDEMESKDLAERVRLIEAMMAEGRRKCESWGWTFVLWGVAYYVAFYWNPYFRYSWPVTVIVAGLLTFLGFMRRRDVAPSTALARAIPSIWIATGFSMFIVFFALGQSGHLPGRTFFSCASAMLGLANVACGLTLKWKAETACGLVWWAAAVAAAVGPQEVGTDAFLVAIFLCQIVFGIYAMILESRRRKMDGALHV